MGQPQPISSLLPGNRENFQPLTGSTQQQTPISRDSKVSTEVKVAMTQLWLRMSEIYGAQFANQFGVIGGEAFQTWCLGLRDMSEAMIKKGFTKLLQRESAFVPNLNEFRKLCLVTPEELGLPSMEVAYLEACNSGHRVLGANWSHPAVYHAGKAVGWFELRNRIAKETRPMFKISYEDICQRVMKGEVFELPEPDATQLEHHTNGKQVTTEQSKAAGQAAIAEMRKAMGMRA